MAQMTGLPAELQRPIIIFWAMKTFSAGISIPRSPLATITPSLSDRISSKLTARLGERGDEEGEGFRVWDKKKGELEKSARGGGSRDEEAEAERTKIILFVSVHDPGCIQMQVWSCRKGFLLLLLLNLQQILRVVMHCDLNPSSGRKPGAYVSNVTQE